MPIVICSFDRSQCKRNENRIEERIFVSDYDMLPHLSLQVVRIVGDGIAGNDHGRSSDPRQSVLSHQRRIWSYKEQRDV